MSASYLARDIAARLHHCASYLQPNYEGLLADLREIGAADISQQKELFNARRNEILATFGYSEPTEQTKPFAYADGVAIIPVHGLLINRLTWSYSFATGYNFIRSQRNAALADPDVKLIVYDVNSPGGIAGGCAELAQEMFDGRGEKPSLAVVDSRCYSAAYFLASAADRVVVTPSGGVGSIGCASLHIDYSDQMNTEGIKATWIFAGAEKVDGNSFERLSTRARASIQRDVDYHYGLFVEAVARQRGLSEDDVRATEAGCFLPPEALDLGLIDAVETPAAAVANFFNEITSDADGGDETMTTKPNETAAPAPAVAAVAPPAPAMTQAEIQMAIATGVATALATERTRASGIRTSEEAKGRETLASHLADNTTLTVDEAKAVMAAAPKTEEKPAPKTETTRQPATFATAMDRTPNPGVGADLPTGGDTTGTDPAPEAVAGRLLGNWTKMTGRKAITIDQPSAGRA